ncbi:hypothetical protein DIPPA_11983 [Diplonema papillatum]|nr:hypothetical protein DIPPA_11983 [Diplonema papillatum]
MPAPPQVGLSTNRLIHGRKSSERYGSHTVAGGGSLLTTEPSVQTQQSAGGSLLSCLRTRLNFSALLASRLPGSEAFMTTSGQGCQGAKGLKRKVSRPHRCVPDRLSMLSYASLSVVLRPSSWFQSCGRCRILSLRAAMRAWMIARIGSTPASCWAVKSLRFFLHPSTQMRARR